MAEVGSLADALDQLAALINSFGLATRTMIRGGVPANSIIDCASEQGCDLIVMARMDDEGGLGCSSAASPKRSYGGHRVPFSWSKARSLSPVIVVPCRRPWTDGYG